MPQRDRPSKHGRELLLPIGRSAASNTSLSVADPGDEPGRGAGHPRQPVAKSVALRTRSSRLSRAPATMPALSESTRCPAPGIRTNSAPGRCEAIISECAMGTNRSAVPAATTTGTPVSAPIASNSSSTANAANSRDQVTTDVSFASTIPSMRSHDSAGRRRPSIVHTAPPARFDRSMVRGARSTARCRKDAAGCVRYRPTPPSVSPPAAVDTNAKPAIRVPIEPGCSRA